MNSAVSACDRVRTSIDHGASRRNPCSRGIGGPIRFEDIGPGTQTTTTAAVSSEGAGRGLDRRSNDGLDGACARSARDGRIRPSYGQRSCQMSGSLWQAVRSRTADGGKGRCARGRAEGRESGDGKWCPGRDLNPDELPHTPLKRTRIPIPPPGQVCRASRRVGRERWYRGRDLNPYALAGTSS